jgi:hypothetical protein
MGLVRKRPRSLWSQATPLREKSQNELITAFAGQEPWRKNTFGKGFFVIS